MTAFTWGDEPRQPQLARYLAVRSAIQHRCAGLPDVAFKAAWRAAIRELKAGTSPAMAVTVGLREAKCFARTTGGAA